MTSLSATTETLARALTVADVMLTGPKRCDPTTTIGDVQRLFVDDHVHAALIVDRRNLLTVVEREDIEGHLDAHALARDLGTLRGRVVRDDTELHEVHHAMLATGRRRLAVLDFTVAASDCSASNAAATASAPTTTLPPQDATNRPPRTMPARWLCGPTALRSRNAARATPNGKPRVGTVRHIEVEA